jgi:hypothetical protein
MAENKTVATNGSVADFIAAIPDPQRRQESRLLVETMNEVSGEPPVLWGKDLVGFGRYTYRYDSGHGGEMFRIGFSPRARELSIYIVPGFDKLQAELRQLGRHRIGKSCLYIKDLAAVDSEVLRNIFIKSLDEMNMRHPA